MAADEMVVVEHLTKRYGRKTAVNDISFSIRKGEIVGLLGPNGAGKTSTMRILSCFLPPTRGSVSINGMDVMRDSLEVRRAIGYLPETVPLYPEMRVYEYLDFRARLKGLHGNKRRERKQAVLKLCGLEDVSRFLIGRLSKGYRQRVGLADCLIHEPKLLILDEPTIGLDPNQIRQTRALIRSLAENHTVLLSTHILSEVEMVCGRVLILNKGRIVASDAPGNLVSLLKGGTVLEAEIRGPAEDIRREMEKLSGATAISVEAEGEWSRLTVEYGGDGDVGAEVFSIVSGRGWVLRRLNSRRRESLEDVFVAMTGGEKRL